MPEVLSIPNDEDSVFSSASMVVAQCDIYSSDYGEFRIEVYEYVVGSNAGKFGATRYRKEEVLLKRGEDGLNAVKAQPAWVVDSNSPWVTEDTAQRALNMALLLLDRNLRRRESQS